MIKNVSICCSWKQRKLSGNRNLDVFTIFIQRRSTDTLYFTTCQRRFQHIGSVQRKESPRSSSGTGAAQSKSPNDTPVLDNFGTDMTRAAAENRLDPIVGREKEIERLAQILSRRKKNNPVLIGEPGVGKSAIVEGLAYLIQRGQVPDILKKYEIIKVNTSALLGIDPVTGDFRPYFLLLFYFNSNRFL